MSFIEKKISIKDLLLWDENARFPDKYYNSDENELIKHFLSKPNFKIKKLIEEIVIDFDLPHLEKVVVWNNDENFIVIEGNRRLIGYIILANPKKVAEFDMKLQNFLLEKKNQISINNDFQLDCLISEDKEQCFRYIDRKHVKGNNEVSWLEPERINYSKRRGIENQNTKLKLAINNYVKTIDLPEEIKNQVLSKGNVTTFYRFLATGPAKDVFGLSIDEQGKLDYEDNDFPEKLKVIIYNVLKKSDFEGNKVNTRVYNKNPEIKKYLKSIKAADAIKVDNDIKKNTNVNIFGDNEIDTARQPRKTQKSTKNEMLFGKILELKRGKVNDLYLAISKIYSQNQHDETILSIIGMSLRLLVEVAARVYYKGDKKANNDKLYLDFLKLSKKEMILTQDNQNFLSLTGSWLEKNTNMEALLGKYAHGNIITTESDILACSNVIGDVLLFYFKR